MHGRKGREHLRTRFRLLIANAPVRERGHLARCLTSGTLGDIAAASDCINNEILDAISPRDKMTGAFGTTMIRNLSMRSNTRGKI